MRLTVRSTGNFSRDTQRLIRNTQGQALVTALVAGALPVQNDAKRRAPYLRGNLRRSIHIGGREDLNPDGGNVEQRTNEPVPGPEVNGPDAAVYVGTDVEYAGPNEFGTSRMGARPYMRPAADSQAGAVQREVAEALRDLIRAALR